MSFRMASKSYERVLRTNQGLFFPTPSIGGCRPEGRTVYGDRLVVEGQLVDARFVGALLTAVVHMIGDFLHGREPDLAGRHHLLDHTFHAQPACETTAEEGMP